MVIPYPPVPAAHQALFNTMNGYLDAFNPGPAIYPTQGTAENPYANSQNELGLLVPGILDLAKRTCDRFKQMNMTAVTFTTHEDIWWEANWTAPQNAAFRVFYSALAAYARSIGLKIIVESAASFFRDYSGLTFAEYEEHRRFALEEIITYIAPDYLFAGDEPDAEAGNTGFTAELSTPSAYATFMTTLLRGLPRGNTLVGCGAGGWLGITWPVALCAIPEVRLYTVHVYPVYGTIPNSTVSCIRVARGTSRRVVIGETWAMKREASESLTPEQYYQRDLFDFWRPIDEKFLSKMWAMCQAEGVDYMSPFWSRYFFVQLRYSADTANLSYTDGQAQITQLSRYEIDAGRFGPLGMYWRALISNGLRATSPQAASSPQAPVNSQPATNALYVPAASYV